MRSSRPRERLSRPLPAHATATRRALLMGLLAAILAATGCWRDGDRSLHPGFDAWYAAHPPEPYSASREERELLDRYRPHLRVPGSASGPIDFYADYIDHGTLVVDGERWTEVDRERLASVAHNPDAEFRHEAPPVKDVQPTAYGRVRYSTIEPFGEFTFLQWHFVFRLSGLPFDLPVWDEALAQMVGIPRDWRQLDHNTAATLVLGPDGTPLGAILQQHEYHRAYWFGRDLAAPEDGRLELAAALRSNELYPWQGQNDHEYHRAARTLTAENLEWLVTGNGIMPPNDGGYDLTMPGEPVDYRLEFLPETDPFYRFRGRLGERRVTPGRDGPPGADFHARPAFQDPALQFCAFRWPDPDEHERMSAMRRLLAHPEHEASRAQLMDDCRDFIAEAIGYNAAAGTPGHAR